MVESRKEQDKNLNINTNNVKEDFYEYKESSHRTQWELAFEQSQYLEQNKNKPRPQLLDLKIEATSHNKKLFKKVKKEIFINLATTYSPFSSTISAKKFHFRVRNEIGWFIFAIATKSTKISNLTILT